jgi:hypothetical protein
MGDFLSDLDPRVGLGAVVLALILETARVFGEGLFGELKLWLKEMLKRRRHSAVPSFLLAHRHGARGSEGRV